MKDIKKPKYKLDDVIIIDLSKIQLPRFSDHDKNTLNAMRKDEVIQSKITFAELKDDGIKDEWFYLLDNLPSPFFLSEIREDQIIMKAS